MRIVNFHLSNDTLYSFFLFFIFCVGLLIFFLISSPLFLYLTFFALLFVSVLLIYNQSPESFAKFIIFSLIFFPKKNIGEDIANTFLLERMMYVGDVLWIYYEKIMLPVLSLSWIIVDLLRSRRVEIIFVLLLLHFCGVYLLNQFYFIPLGFWEYLPNLSVILFPLVLIHWKDFVSSRLFFLKSSLILVVIFYIEIFLVSIGIIPFSLSYDYREGFRSIMNGFAVQVGFWLMIGTFSSIYLYISSNKKRYLFFLVASVLLQFSTFDRGNLYLSFLLILVFGLKYRFRMTTFALVLIALFSAPIFSSIKKTEMYQVKSAIDESGVLGASSVLDRFEIQLDYFKGIIYNFGLPSGFDTNRVRYNQATNSQLTNSKISIASSHSLFIQTIFEYGAIIVFIYLYLFKIYVRMMHVNFEGRLLIFILLVYWLFQAFPPYLFMIPIVLSLWAVKRQPVL
jgi:hypothetical protein